MSHSAESRITTRLLAITAIIAAVLLAYLFIAGKTDPANAAEKSWTGCYGGASGNYSAAVLGDVIGTDGPGVSILAGCDLQAQKLVFGGWAEYGWDFRELGPVSVDVDGWAAGGRVGYLVTPGALAYALAGYTDLNFDIGPGSADATGWLAGGGTELDIGGGFYLRAEYRYTRLDLDFTTADDNVQSGRFAVVYKLGGNPIDAPAFKDYVAPKPLK